MNWSSVGAIGGKSIITKKLQLNKKMAMAFYDHKEIQIIYFETTKLACPWILGNLIVFQFFLLLLVFTKTYRKNWTKNKEH